MDRSIKKNETLYFFYNNFWYFFNLTHLLIYIPFILCYTFTRIRGMKMIEFFRDVLDGPVYIVTTILSIIFIMAIIGFLMERKKLEKEQKSKIAVVGTNQPEVVPITPVAVQSSVEPTIQPVQQPVSQPTVQTVAQPAVPQQPVQTPIQPTPVPQASVAPTQPVVAQTAVASQVVTLENPNANPQ